MKVLITFVIVVISALLGAIGVAYSGLYDVSASSPKSGFVNWLLSTASHAFVERRARDIEVPILEVEALQLAGVSDFNSMCAGCHGAPGQEPQAMGQGLNPPAPDLAESAANMTPAELFWVSKNGIKMTGMPAWGTTHDDDALWPVIAFLKKLPNLDAAEYQAMLANAEGIGHHAETDESEQLDDSPPAPEKHDHSTHKH